MDDGRAREEGTGGWLRQQYFNSGTIPQTPGVFPNPATLRETTGFPPPYQQQGEPTRGMNDTFGQYYPPITAGFGNRASFSKSEIDDPFAFSDQSSNGIKPNSSFGSLGGDISQGQQTVFRGQGHSDMNKETGISKYGLFPGDGVSLESKESRFTSYNGEGSTKVEERTMDMFNKLQRSRSDTFLSPVQKEAYRFPTSLPTKTTQEELLNTEDYLGQKHRRTEDISKTDSPSRFTWDNSHKSDGLSGLKQLHDKLETQKMDYAKLSQFPINPMSARDIYSPVPFHETLSGKSTSNDPHHNNVIPFPFSAKLPLNGYPENGYNKSLHSTEMNNTASFGSRLPYPFLPPHDPYRLNGLDNSVKKLKKNGMIGQDFANGSILKRKEKVDGDSIGFLPKKKKVKKQKDKVNMPSVTHYPGSELGEFNTDSANSERQNECHHSQLSPLNCKKSHDLTSDQVNANVEKILNSVHSLKDKNCDVKPSLNIPVSLSLSKQDSSSTSQQNINHLNKHVPSITKGSFFENCEELTLPSEQNSPCCENCEKLGKRFSPLCSNKYHSVPVSNNSIHTDFSGILPPIGSLGFQSIKSIGNQTYTSSQSGIPVNTTLCGSSTGSLCSVASGPLKTEMVTTTKFSDMDLKNLKEAEKENMCEGGKCNTDSILYTTENIAMGKNDGESPSIDHQVAWVSEHVQKLKSVVTGEEPDDLIDRLKKNIKVEVPRCTCRGPEYIPTEEAEGPYYTHLGSGRSIQAIREMMETRTGVKGKAIRMEKIRYSGREGKSSQGCPIAKWIIRRSSIDEKYLCVVRQREGHHCDTAFLVVVIVAWEGVPQPVADGMYDYLVQGMSKYGFETERRCGMNDRKTCACQGIDLMKRGASFSFGCSWSMYFNGCKFARSREARKFKLKDTTQEQELEKRLQSLATDVAPLYKQVAPDAYNNQTQFEKEAGDCRLGNKEGRPFSGVTACVDFCAHAHKDFHNMNNGSTVVVTLTKHRGLNKPEDEQLHVLPLYVMDLEDEHGSRDGQLEKIEAGSLEVLQIYPMEARTRSSPLTPKRKKGKKDKESPGPKKRGPKKGSTRGNSVSPQEKGNLPNQHSQDSNQSDNLYFQSSQQPGKPGTDLNMCRGSEQFSHSTTYVKNEGQSLKLDVRKLIAGKTFLTYEDMMMLSSEPGFSNLYESFWNYFYSCGTFPPPSFLNSWYGDKGEPGQASSGQLNNSGQIDTQAGKGHNSSQPTDPSVISQTSISQNTHCQGAVNIHSPHVDPNHPLSLSQRQQATPNQGMDLSKSGSQNELEAAFRNGNFIKQEHGTHSMDRVRPASVQLESDKHTSFESPLHLLSEAVTMRTKEFDNNSLCNDAIPKRPSSVGSLPSNLPQSFRGDNSSHLPFQGSSSQSLPYHQQQHSNKTATEFISSNMSASHHDPFNDFAIPFPSTQESARSDSVIDPTVVKCEMEYNENAFTDPSIGGVAIALSHGAVLFEVAKRELHATTGLRNPNRYAPTRISLVFYQHKNLNHPNHGWHEYERKLERLRQQRMEKLKEESTGIKLDLPEVPVKNGVKKTKKSKKEKVDIMETSAAQYKYMWEAPTVRSESLTTDSVITRWIDPQPMVTGPYQRWV